MIGTRRRLPPYLGGGDVSPLAWKICALALGDGVSLPRKLPSLPRVTVTTSDATLFAYLAEQLEVDEADVLRAMAELQRAGALGTKGEA